MKVIFSRKGFDGASGGVPSPIVDGVPISLPIPSDLEHTHFDDLKDPIPRMVSDLTRNRITAASYCHLDPDIDHSSFRRGRSAGWRGALGQIGTSQGHLERQGIGPGDLFLFWGLFQHVTKAGNKWRYVGNPMHLLFGWLQIAEVHHVGNQGAQLLSRHPWLRDHAHTRPGWERWSTHEKSNNTIYIADERLTALPGAMLPGYGTLKRGFVLSAPDEVRKSIWYVPDWLHPTKGGCGMSYHNATNRWLSQNKVQTVGRGQEFVADVGDSENASRWLREVLETGVAPLSPENRT